MLEMLKVTELMVIYQTAPHSEEPAQFFSVITKMHIMIMLFIMLFFFTEMIETEMKTAFVSIAKLRENIWNESMCLHHRAANTFH